MDHWGCNFLFFILEELIVINLQLTGVSAELWGFQWFHGDKSNTGLFFSFACLTRPRGTKILFTKCLIVWSCFIHVDVSEKRPTVEGVVSVRYDGCNCTTCVSHTHTLSRHYDLVRIKGMEEGFRQLLLLLLFSSSSKDLRRWIFNDLVFIVALVMMAFHLLGVVVWHGF